MTIEASNPNTGRVDRAHLGKPNSADTEPRPIVSTEDIEATRTELAELRRRMTRKAHHVNLACRFLLHHKQ